MVFDFLDIMYIFKNYNICMYKNCMYCFYLEGELGVLK